MAVIAREILDSRAVVRDGTNSTYSRTYRMATRGDNTAAVMSELLAIAPPSVIVDGISLNQVVPSLTPLPNGYWHGTVLYRAEASTNADSQDQNLDEVDKWQVTYDLGTKSASTIFAVKDGDDYAVGGVSPPRSETIVGDQDSGRNETSILVPGGSLQIQRVFSYDVLFANNSKWLTDRAAIRCHTNTDTYYGFPAGSLLFTRMGFTIRNNSDCLVTFQFQQAENETIPADVYGTGEPDDPATPKDVTKGGHQVLWGMYNVTDGTNAAGDPISITRMSSLHVSTIYKESAFGNIDQPVDL